MPHFYPMAPPKRLPLTSSPAALTPLTIGVHFVLGPRQAPIAPAIFGIGLSFLLPSDGISIEIGGIGILENPVLADML